ncbi:methionine--tRNA ligase, mitochondrial-like [Antedon mediterranea]|uniref:methionine--tRNA ligase, mitochondrial-like n=1 Tax=Antedon mediterranea TaxID=105859 RepID=UPI003AF4A7C2
MLLQTMHFWSNLLGVSTVLKSGALKKVDKIVAVGILTRFKHQSSFITTPIFYVNASPHIGHLYSALLADVTHRWQVICGDTGAIFSTGTDEHGQKVQQSADSHNCQPKIFCDKVSSDFKRIFDLCEISYTDFVRTTDHRHQKAVEHFWNKLYSAGYLYEGKYEGWYSTSDESFLTPSQVIDTPDGKLSVESGHPVHWTTEHNYMFRLSQFESKLLEWIENNKRAIYPSMFADIVREWIKAGLQDLSVSRQRNRLQWGIQVPNDPSQTIYVWLDALVNYLTVSGYPDKLVSWPATHIIGKDILKFHAIYWPAFLMAAGMEPPASIVCHSHWTRDGSKMSKSIGNVVDPNECVKKLTCDGFRFCLLREDLLHSDGDYKEEKIAAILNAELADTFGNLLSRVTARSLNPDQTFPEFHTDLFPIHPDGSCRSRATKEDYELLEKLEHLPELVDKYYQDFKPYKSIEAIMSCLRLTNAFIQQHEPWTLVKNPTDENRAWLDTVIHVAMDSLRICSLLLQPIIPIFCNRLLTRLGVLQTERTNKHLKMFRTQLGNQHSLRKLGTNDNVMFKKIKI